MSSAKACAPSRSGTVFSNIFNEASAAIVNKMGLRGHPCITPTVASKAGLVVSPPGKKTQTLRKVALTMLIVAADAPARLSAARSAPLSMDGNAAATSKDIIDGAWTGPDRSATCRTVRRLAAASSSTAVSVGRRPGRKPRWCERIVLWTAFVSWRAWRPAIVFESTFFNPKGRVRPGGRSAPVASAVSVPLRMQMRVVWLKEGGGVPPPMMCKRNLCTTLAALSPPACQAL